MSSLRAVHSFNFYFLLKWRYLFFVIHTLSHKVSSLSCFPIPAFAWEFLQTRRQTFCVCCRKRLGLDSESCRKRLQPHKLKSILSSAATLWPTCKKPTPELIIFLRCQQYKREHWILRSPDDHPPSTTTSTPFWDSRNWLHQYMLSFGEKTLRFEQSPAVLKYTLST